MKFLKIIVLFALLFSLYGNATKMSADDPVITLEQHIQRIFGSKAKVALAVLKHESNLKLNSINYNCRYNGRSTFCKKGDEYKAWSVDCGLIQRNFKGQVCPSRMFTLEGNIQELELVYKQQGLNAWVSYRTGAYKKYL